MTTGATQKYVLAIDLGTTSTKTLIIDLSGKVKASHAVEYPLYTPNSEMAEQDPEEIFAAVLEAVKAVIELSSIDTNELLCASFSSAMHTLILVDQHGKPLTRSMTFADNRSSQYVHVLREQHDAHQIYRNTGTPIHPMSPLLKLMWLREHRPELFRQTAKCIGIKEYVMAKLLNQYVVDYSIASATGLFNLKQLDWDESALRAAGIDRDMLSEPVNTTHAISGLTPALAVQLGVREDLPFVVGASDGVLANLGIGAVDPGVFAVTIGTSGAVRGVVRKPITDPKERLFCYALHEDYWVIGGSINNGGVMLRWVRDQLATLETALAVDKGVDPYQALTEIAAEVPAGSEGLIFLPLLAGERAPFWNADARGVFFGLSLYHQKKHMIRAVMEGVMYRIKSVVQALEDIGEPAKEMRASGGFARSVFWRQMMADVLGKSVAIPQSIESSGLGAAKLGLLSMGVVQKLEQLDDWVKIDARHSCYHDHHAVYQQLYPIYMDVYHQLKAPFTAISQFQKMKEGPTI